DRVAPRARTPLVLPKRALLAAEKPWQSIAKRRASNPSPLGGADNAARSAIRQEVLAAPDYAALACSTGWMAWNGTHSRFQTLIMPIATLSLTNSSSEKCCRVASYSAS